MGCVTRRPQITLALENRIRLHEAFAGGVE
jgi:hypothetical protein